MSARITAADVQIYVNNSTTDGERQISAMVTGLRRVYAVDFNPRWSANVRRTPLVGSLYLEEADPTQAGIPMRLRVLQVLGDLADVGATGKQLMAELGLDDKGRSAFYKAMNKLRDDGQVVERGPKNRPRYFRTEYAPDLP